MLCRPLSLGFLQAADDQDVQHKAKKKDPDGEKQTQVT
jgi:hypothetical protein